MFYKEDNIIDKMNNIFTNKSKNELSEEFNTLEKLEAFDLEASTHPLYSEIAEDINNARIILEGKVLEFTEAKVSNFKSFNDERLASYDELFKVPLEKVTSITTNGGQYASNDISRAMDGDVNTNWHSGKQNTSSHTNEVVITLDELTTIDRIMYTSLVSRGFAQEFEIYGSRTSEGDTFEKIYEKGLLVEPKNFSVGVRIEHLQSEINKSQYGTITKLNLPSADYKLAYHSPSGRSCYTFCMCPGGVVMASSSEKNTIVTNGMSYFARNGINANSAVLVNVVPSDFNSNSPLAGIYFQKDLEEKAFKLGGTNYFAPIQRFEDFANNKKSEFIGSIKPSYTPGVTLANLNDIMPEFVSKTLREGIIYFDTKLHGFANPDAIITGMETRSSSPVRIFRNDKGLNR